MAGSQILQLAYPLTFILKMQPHMLQALKMEISIDVRFHTMNNTWKPTLHTQVQFIVYALVRAGRMCLCRVLPIGQ